MKLEYTSQFAENSSGTQKPASKYFLQKEKKKKKLKSLFKRCAQAAYLWLDQIWTVGLFGLADGQTEGKRPEQAHNINDFSKAQSKCTACSPSETHKTQRD